MKYLFLILILFILNGCSHKNAFYNFNMDEHQQLSAQNFKRIKLTKNNETIGTVSTIYLNEIFPNKYNKNEYFFVYVYLKEGYNIDNYRIKLNNNDSLKIKELEHDNKFSKLVKEKNRWSTYYLVSFERSGKSMNLTLGNDQLILASINYQKDE